MDKVTGSIEKPHRAEDIVPAHIQAGFDIRCEWGLAGITALAPTSEIVIVIDVLSFTTCVDIATGNGAVVLPYRFRDDTATSFAAQTDALLASSRNSRGYSLSPMSLLKIPDGTRLVLPSPNGATISLAAPSAKTIAGCLRNATAVARAAGRLGARTSVIPAGEKWVDGSLRPALEDWLGAGAVIAALDGSKSPEAMSAEIMFNASINKLPELVGSCASAREIIDRGFASDVEISANFDCSNAVPVLENGAYCASIPH